MLPTVSTHLDNYSKLSSIGDGQLVGCCVETTPTSNNFTTPLIETTELPTAGVEIKPILLAGPSLRRMDFLPKILTRNDVENILHEFEKKYGVCSEEFYSMWRRGQAVDSLDSLKWATMYEAFKEGYIV